MESKLGMHRSNIGISIVPDIGKNSRSIIGENAPIHKGQSISMLCIVSVIMQKQYGHIVT